MLVAMTMTARFRLLEIADIRSGYLTRTGVEPKGAGSHYLLQIRDFNPQRTVVHKDNLVRFTPEVLASVQPIHDGDVIFLAKGVNNFAYSVSGLPAPTLAASCFFVLRPHPQLLPVYLAWFLNQPSTRQELSRFASSGVRMPVVRRSVLEKTEIPLPALTVQEGIAEMDKLMIQEQDMITELARKKQKLVSAICMKAARGL
jgi:hypothetical protein